MIRFCAFALVAALATLSGCSRTPRHTGWVIHSALEVVGPPPAGGYRLAFPYIVGDLYGSPNTGDFVAPVSRTPGAFTLDLNRTQSALESELGPTDFSLRFLRITPAEARIARLAPVALERTGIDPVGTVEWLDAQSRRPLMLIYIDRPAWIAGSLTRAGATIRYDIRVAKPGYVWVGGVPAGEHDTLYTVVPQPQHLILTITTRAARPASWERRSVQWYLRPMKAIRRYSLQFEADLARIALEGADIPAVVVGVDVGFSGMGGVQLLVPEDCVDAARKVLEDLDEPNGPKGPKGPKPTT